MQAIKQHELSKWGHGPVEEKKLIVNAVLTTEYVSKLRRVPCVLSPLVLGSALVLLSLRYTKVHDNQNMFYIAHL